jgi:hypothetical protein
MRPYPACSNHLAVPAAATTLLPPACGFSGAIAAPPRLLPLTGKPSTQTLKPGKEKGNLKLKPLNSNLVATPSTSPLCSPVADGIWVWRGILMSSSSFKRHFRGGVEFRGGGCTALELPGLNLAITHMLPRNYARSVFIYLDYFIGEP